MRMYNNYKKYENIEIKCDISKSDMIDRYNEIKDRYEYEESKLYKCIDDFNQNMSQYLVLSNKERMKKDFIKSLTE